MVFVDNSIMFNHSKSVCMKAGPNWCKPTADMFLGNMKLEGVIPVCIKYLGIGFNSGFKMRIDTSYIRRKFYASCNGILAHCKSADEFVRLSLVKSFCLPLLCYCFGALELSRNKCKAYLYAGTIVSGVFLALNVLNLLNVCSFIIL